MKSLNLTFLFLLFFAGGNFIFESASAKSLPNEANLYLAKDVPEAFEGIVAFSNCSGFLMKFKNQSSNQKAMIFTNDHCVYDQPYNQFMLNKPYSRTLKIFAKDGRPVNHTFTTTRIIYAVQTDTDFAILELPESYAQIEKDYGILPLELDVARANVGDETQIISGYLSKIFECSVDAYVYKLQEDTWFWRDVYRNAGCNPGHGTSGSPMLLKDTRFVIGISNTGNDNGERCTLNNPCEISANGSVSIMKGRSYGQRLDNIYTCLDDQSQFNLKQKGCKLLGGDGRISKSESMYF